MARQSFDYTPYQCVSNCISVIKETTQFHPPRLILFSAETERYDFSQVSPTHQRFKLSIILKFFPSIFQETTGLLNDLYWAEKRKALLETDMNDSSR